MGDGGSGNDPENRAQNTRELLGQILRIRVSEKPGSNPIDYCDQHVSSALCGERGSLSRVAEISSIFVEDCTKWPTIASVI
jgi:hypothetical protein